MSSAESVTTPTVTETCHVLADTRRAELDHLGEAIAELSARLSAATYELLVLIRRFDEREGWHGGFQSCAHWLSAPCVGQHAVGPGGGCGCHGCFGSHETMIRPSFSAA